MRCVAAILASMCVGSMTACEASSAASEAELGLGDLSFLLPLDGPELRAETRGSFGPLLPRARFDAIEPLTRVDEPDVLYANLQVVAVRLDPCFIEGSATTSCKSQVRLVLQPVLEVDGVLTTRDASMHTFYEVPLDELKALAQSLAAIRPEVPTGIGLHPAPERAIDLLLRHLGERRLSRVTAMSVHPSSDAWIFSGTDIGGVNRPSLPIVITGVDMTDQHVTSTGGRDTLAATLLPDPTIEPAIAGYLDAEDRGLLTTEETTSAESALERLLDPAMHNPGTVDCASCHIATMAYRFATRDRDLVPPVYDDTRNQRMFGYFGEAPSVSPRVVAETRAVLEWLATHE